MNDRISRLYEKLFEAEKQGDEEKIADINLSIRKLFDGLVGVTHTKEELVTRFFVSVKNKPFLKNLIRMLNDEPLSDLCVAKMVSSFITHVVIEMEHSGTEVYAYLELKEQVSLLNEFISGRIGEKEVRAYYRERYSRYF